MLHESIHLKTHNSRIKNFYDLFVIFVNSTEINTRNILFSAVHWTTDINDFTHTRYR